MEQQIVSEKEELVFLAADCFESIPAVFRDRAAKQPDEIAYSQADARLLVEEEMLAAAEAPAAFDPAGQSIAELPSPEESLPWREVSYNALESEVEEIAAGLGSLGVERGVRCAILSNTRPEWMKAELGIMTAGGAVVTCYTSDPAERIGFVLWDSSSDIVFVENQEQLDKVLAVIENGVDTPATELHEAGHKQLMTDRIITIEEVEVPEKFKSIVMSVEELKELGRGYEGQLREERHRPRSDDEATLIYTSGTTGAPKGVIATHAQHLANVRQIVRSGIVGKIKKSFQLLPLAHGFGLQLLHVLIAHGGQAVFPRIVDPKSSALTPEVRKALKTDLKDGNAQLIALVPKVLQGMKDKLLLEAEKPGLKSRLLKLVIHTYRKQWEADCKEEEADWKTHFVHTFLESKWCGALGPFVKRQIKENMVGEDFEYFISGGAPLSEELFDFFCPLDIGIFEGYGSTEANVPVSANRPGMFKKGSVGTPFDEDIQVELTEEGELLVSGPNIATGYNNRPEATAKTWDSLRRLHTRDRATIDEDGFIFIKGRVDDLIVLSNGKNIEPEPIEERLRQHPLVKEGMLVGHGMESLIALVVLDREAVDARKSDLEASGKAVTKAGLERAICAEIKEFTNSEIEKQTEQIKGVLSIPEPSVGDGYTPTMKLQKKKIAKKYEKLIKHFQQVIPRKEKVRSTVKDSLSSLHESSRNGIEPESDDSWKLSRGDVSKGEHKNSPPSSNA